MRLNRENAVENNSQSASIKPLSAVVRAVVGQSLMERLESKTRALMVSEVAALLNISERQVYKLASEQRIPSLRIAGSIRFDAALLASWLREHSGGGK